MTDYAAELAVDRIVDEPCGELAAVGVDDRLHQHLRGAQLARVSDDHGLLRPIWSAAR
jgi:hypothetical protein